LPISKAKEEKSGKWDGGGKGMGRNEREGKRRGPQGLVHTPCPKSLKGYFTH